MGTRTAIVFLLSLITRMLCAQKVVYSPFIGNEAQTRFEVIGKSGNYYWVQKSRYKSRSRKLIEPWIDDKELKFEIYDDRVKLVKTIPSFISENIIKEYFVPGDEYFDQLFFSPGGQKIAVLLNRYTAGGDLIRNGDTLCALPAKMKCGDFLLIRSQDKSKMLLLAFETIAESLPKLHSFLYDKNWNLLHHTVYTNTNISKPFVQYDLLDYPLEHFNSNPIKLNNNGEWLMAVSSRVNQNYLLCHFGTNEEFVCKEIKLPLALSVEEIVLSSDNEKKEAFAGILSRVRNPAVKDVRMIHYSLTEKKIDFDTSYRFNTLATNKTKSENIYEEYLLTIPSKGCMLLKEYGRPFSSKYLEEQEAGEENSVANNPVPSNITRNEYTRYGNLFGARSKFDRGDLSLYFFPATTRDTCWSGIINKEQMTELSSSYLSYVFLPKEEKLFFLYNSFFKSSDNQYSTTTILDQKGNALDEGVVYWTMKNTLVFQKARQISENELAIPYERNARKGFAIIRL